MQCTPHGLLVIPEVAPEPRKIHTHYRGEGVSARKGGGGELRQRELCGQRLWSGREYGTFWNRQSKGEVAGEGAGEEKEGQGPAGRPTETNLVPEGIKSHRKGLVRSCFISCHLHCGDMTRLVF